MEAEGLGLKAWTPDPGVVDSGFALVSGRGQEDGEALAFLQEWMGHACSWMERLVEGKSTKPLGQLHLQGWPSVLPSLLAECTLAQCAALPAGIQLWPDHMCSGQMSPGLPL